MVRAGTVALMVVLLGVGVMNAPGMLGGATAAEDPVKFSKPTFVDPPKTLQGIPVTDAVPTPPSRVSKTWTTSCSGGRTSCAPTMSCSATRAPTASPLGEFGASAGELVPLNDGSGNFLSRPSSGPGCGTSRSTSRWPSTRTSRIRFCTTTSAFSTPSPCLRRHPIPPAAWRCWPATSPAMASMRSWCFPRGSESPNAIVGTAVDVQNNNTIPLLRFGPSFPVVGHVVPFSIARAAVLGTPRVFVAGPAGSNSSCPTGFTGLQFESYTVDPQSLELISMGTFSATIPEGQGACLHGVDVTSGRFTTSLHDQLLVAYGMQGAR